MLRHLVQLPFLKKKDMKNQRKKFRMKKMMFLLPRFFMT
jgi:hypothetical protein